MKLKTRIIAFILMLLTAFYAVPVSAFAKVAFSDKSGEKSKSSSAEVQASCDNSHGELISITTDSTAYTFTYDGYGNSSSVQAGDGSDTAGPANSK